MIKVYFDQGPLHSGHNLRGIGRYTAWLTEALTEQTEVELVSTVHEADLVHYPTFDLFKPTLPLFFRKPTVLTIHDVIPLQMPESYPIGVRAKIALQYQKTQLRQVAKIITDSKSSKGSIMEYLGVPSSKIEVVWLAANPELTFPKPLEYRQILQKLQLPPQYILYVGDINPNKNIPGLLEAVSLLPKKVHLVCVGSAFRPQPIPEWSAIASALESFQLRDRVTLLSSLPEPFSASLAVLYHEAACYVQPSLLEGFGLPILEAQICQVPVVTAKQSSMAEVAGKHAIYATSPKPQDLSAAIVQALSLPASARKTLVSEALDWAKQSSWAETAAQTVAVYKSVLT